MITVETGPSMKSQLHQSDCSESPLFEYFLFPVFIASAVKFNHTLQDLFLGDNKLISSDGQTLGAMLKGNDHLQLLDLRNNPLQVPFLIYLLLQLGSSSFLSVKV